MSNSRAIQCECVKARIGSINTPAGRQSVLILELYSDGLEFPVIKFFNAEKSKAGNYTVRHDSDFAKLYRLTLGEVKAERFSRSQHLLGHFLGYQFIVTAEQFVQDKREPYLKATKIHPVDPIKSVSWTETGVQKPKPKRRKKLRNNSAIFTQDLRNNSAIFTQDLRNAKSLQPAKTLGLQPFSIPLYHNNAFQQYHNTTIPLSHVSDSVVDAVTLPAETEPRTPAETEPRVTPNHSHGQTGQTGRIDELNPPDDVDYYAGINQQFDEVKPISPKTERPIPQHHVYHQRPDETRNEYWDRVINESLPDWEDKF